MTSISPVALKAAIQEIASAEASTLRGSAGSSVVYDEIVGLQPRIAEVLAFVAACRVTGASLSLVAGHAPMVRVRLRASGRTRTVNPSSWLADVLNAAGLPLGQASRSVKAGFPERVAAKLRKLLPNERIECLDADIQAARTEALADRKKVGEVQERLAKKRETERQRQLKIVSHAFKNVPHDLLSEEEVLQLWRENQIRHVLET